MTAYGPIDSDQEKYSLLDREIETNGMLDYCRRQSIAVLAYSPLANGLLTGKIRPDRQFGPGDLRRGNRRFTPANIERINAMLRQLRPMAERHKATIAQLVIAWTFSQPGMTCVLCGARDAAASRSRTPPPAASAFRPRSWKRSARSSTRRLCFSITRHSRNQTMPYFEQEETEETEDYPVSVASVSSCSDPFAKKTLRMFPQSQNLMA